MDKVINRIGYGFIALLLLTFFGFYLTYFGKFPEFENITLPMHFHAIVFLAWYALLIVQPFLIRYKKTALHRTLGKLSYPLMPIVLLSIYLATKGQFQRGELQQMPLNENRAQTFMPMSLMFLFGFFYLLAMLNSSKMATHMRYIIASSLVLLGPIFGRVLIIWLGVNPHDGIWYGGLLSADIALATMFVIDMVNRKSNFSYGIALALSLTLHIAWYLNFQATEAWQVVARAIF